MKIQYFNKFIIQTCVDTHLHYLLTFKAASGKAVYKDGNISFFNVGTVEHFIDAVLKLQTVFVKDNLLFLEVAIPNRNQYGRLVPEYIKDTVFLKVIQ
jgi:hypothetical protein